MADLKIAVLGAGSFVFGPGVLSQAILENNLGSVELALMDTDAEVLGLMAGLGRLMAVESHKPVRITTHTERDTALAGADYVICAAAVQGRRRYQIDHDLIQQFYPGHMITEFGGVAGISYSLRQIALILDITADMKRRCPDAWLLNVANPLPRVCQAAHADGIQTVGFCSVALAAHSALWQLLRGDPPLAYPFTPAIKMWQMTTAGVNHFTWVLELADRQTGADLLPRVRQCIASGATSGNPQTEALCRETGYLLAAGDNHVRDFLKPPRPVPAPHVPFHGDERERWQRLQLLRTIVADELNWEPLFEQVSWERPVDFIAAHTGSRELTFSALNLSNAGQMPDLPAGVFVETPCTVRAGHVQPQRIDLPESVQAMTRHPAQVSDTITRAALTRSRKLVYEAVELDPTIEDKAAGIRAVDACMAAHADLLPAYS